MKSMNVFFVALLSLLLFSCKKQDQPTPVPGLEQKMLKKISTSDREFEMFTYNTNKQLIKLTSQYIDDYLNNTVATDESIFTYQGNQLSKIQHETGSMEYFYFRGITLLRNNPRKVKVYNHNNVLESDMTVSFEYDAAGYITKKTIHTVGSPNPEISFFEYY